MFFVLVLAGLSCFAESPSLLIVGDSHAANRLPHSPVAAWIVADLLGVSPSNRLAVSGSTAAQWAADLNGMMTSATNNRAPVVWISLGGNDAAAAASDGSVTTEECYRIAADLYNAVFALSRGRRLVICTLYADPHQGALPDYAWAVGRLDAGITDVCSLACRASGTPLRFLDERWTLCSWNYDGSGDLHPDAAGYTNMAVQISKIISSLTTNTNHQTERHP
jgi:lysophospholipase L1-like esterase